MRDKQAGCAIGTIWCKVQDKKAGVISARMILDTFKKYNVQYVWYAEINSHFTDKNNEVEIPSLRVNSQVATLFMGWAKNTSNKAKVFKEGELLKIMQKHYLKGTLRRHYHTAKKILPVELRDATSTELNFNK